VRELYAVFKEVFTVAPDGKSMKVTESDPRSGSKDYYIVDKQP
jgi:hypothetical protein